MEPLPGLGNDGELLLCSKVFCKRCAAPGGPMETHDCAAGKRIRYTAAQWAEGPLPRKEWEALRAANKRQAPQQQQQQQGQQQQEGQQQQKHQQEQQRQQQRTQEPTWEQNGTGVLAMAAKPVFGRQPLLQGTGTKQLQVSGTGWMAAWSCYLL